MKFTATAHDLELVLGWFLGVRNITYLYIRLAVCDMLDIGRVFHKIGPPGSKLWITDLAVFQLESKVHINGNELSVHPSEKNVESHTLCMSG